jgi:hypothetical protein
MLQHSRKSVIIIWVTMDMEDVRTSLPLATLAKGDDEELRTLNLRTTTIHR